MLRTVDPHPFSFMPQGRTRFLGTTLGSCVSYPVWKARKGCLILLCGSVAARWTSKHLRCPWQGLDTPKPLSRAMGAVLVLSDAENGADMWVSALDCPNQRPSKRTTLATIVSVGLVGFTGSRWCEVAKECYLVDPASSHMLVSKIKPCMCKYELIQTAKLRMAH